MDLLKDLPSVEGETYSVIKKALNECIRSRTIWFEIRIVKLMGIQIVHGWMSMWIHVGEKFLGQTCLNRQPVNAQLASVNVNLTESEG